MSLRILSLIVLGGVALGAILGIPHQRSRVSACSIIASTFEGDVSRAHLVLLADVLEVGGSVNGAATLSPTPTSTPTHIPAATRTPKGTHSPTATPAEPSSTTMSATPDQLLGQRATLNVVHVYAGQPEPRFIIDASARAIYERGLRNAEAGSYPPCPPLPAARYVEGGRYLVLAERSPEGDYSTSRRLRVEGDDVVLHEDVYGSQYAVVLQFQGATYRRYFANVAARLDSGTDNDYATITADRLPLATLVRAITDIRNGTSIAPPETGSAGLAPGRR